MTNLIDSIDKINILNMIWFYWFIFQVEVEVDGRWYTGEENCSSKKDAEHSAAQKACADLIRNNLELDSREQPPADPAVNDNDLLKHLPTEYVDIEESIATMLAAFKSNSKSPTTWYPWDI
jgi:hypothetical protein